MTTVITGVDADDDDTVIATCFHDPVTNPTSAVTEAVVAAALPT